MERDISVRPTEMTRPVKEDHPQSWSRLFRSDETEMLRFIRRNNWNFWTAPEYSGRTKPKWSVSFDVPTETSEILGWMESALVLLTRASNNYFNTQLTDTFQAICLPPLVFREKVDKQLHYWQPVCKNKDANKPKLRQLFFRLTLDGR